MQLLRTKAPPAERWYDFYDDWDLIEASLFQQYGLRIRKELHDISWDEFCTHVSGLLPDTPLGKIVTIRSETDKNVLKNYTPQMRAIRSKWTNKMAQEKLKDVEHLDQEFDAWETVLAKMFGNKDT